MTATTRESVSVYVCGVLGVLLLCAGLTPAAQAQTDYALPTIHIGVVVSDLDRAMDFYQNVMGMTKVNLYDLDGDFARRSGLSGGIPFKVEVLKIADTPAATEFKLVSFGKQPEHPDQKWIQDDTGMQYITLMVNNLKPFLDRFADHNIPLLGETPTPINDSVSFVLIQDPDGNFIELIGPPLAE